MHMEQPFCPRALVQIVDILRDDQQFARPFGIEPRQRQMRRIGLHLGERRAPEVVEAMHQLGIPRQRLRRADILDPMPFPQPTRPTKRRDAALGGNAGASQDDDIAEVGHRTGLIKHIAIGHRGGATIARCAT